MKEKLFDVLVAGMCDGETNSANLADLLLVEIFDMDEEITVEDAEKFANDFIDQNYIDAYDAAQKLNEEAIDFLRERELAAIGW